MTSYPSAPAGDAVSTAGQLRSDVVRTSSELQAIRDRSGRKIGYELFYRGSELAQSALERGTAATLSVLAGLTVAPRGEHAPGSYLYFVNVTRDFLVGQVDFPDPSEVAVLELQPDVLADAAVCAGAADLRRRGYGVALDRYLPGQDNQHDQLLPLASHVKLDLDGGDEPMLRHAAHRVRAGSNALLVGCRIGSERLLDLARDLGCDLFQGRAVDGSGRQRHEAVAGSLTSYIKLLELLATDDALVDLRRVTEAVMRDADLSMRVLRACNSVGAGSAREISSISQAVVLLGVRQLRRLVHLAVAQGLAVQGEAQLVQLIEYSALTELVSLELGVRGGTGFLAGLLQEVAGALDRPLAVLVDDLPLDTRLATDLRTRQGDVGRALDLVEAYKQGTPLPDGVPIQRIAALHARAMLGATGITQAIDEPGPEDGQPVMLPPVGQPAVPPPTADGPRTSADEQARRRFRDGSVPVADLAGLLPVDPDRLRLLVERRALICDDVDGVLQVPVWQFGLDGRLIDGIEDVVDRLAGDAVAGADWLTRPCRGLSGQIPLAVLLQGGRAAVLDAHGQGKDGV